MEATLDLIRIGGEEYTVDGIVLSNHCSVGNVVSIRTMEGPEFYLAEDSEEAGKVAKERWADMAENDKQEFRCIVGDSVLLNWAMGIADGPGQDKSATSVQEWLEIIADNPHEELASYDGEEIEDIELSEELQAEIGFFPEVAYRSN